MMKTCKRCKSEKPLSEFYSNATYAKQRDGYSPICKACLRQTAKESRDRVTRRDQIADDLDIQALMVWVDKTANYRNLDSLRLLRQRLDDVIRREENKFRGHHDDSSGRFTAP